MTKVKFFILGIIFSALVYIYVPSYGYLSDSIKVRWNIVKVKVNGEYFNGKSLIYNEKTYVPLRDFANFLQKDVSWNNNKTISVDDKIPSKTSSSCPANINSKREICFEDDFGIKYSAELYVEEIMRGNTAWQYIKSITGFSNPIFDNTEFLLAKINFKLISANNDTKTYNLRSYQFSLISENGVEYEYVPININSKINTLLKTSESTNGWVPFQVNTSDLKPKITFGNNNGIPAVWIKTNK